MMKFKNYLKEILTKKPSVKTVHKGAMDYESQFEAAGETYVFRAHDAMYTDDWAIFFHKLNVDPNKPWEPSGDKGSQAFEVFAGVGEALKKFIKKQKPEYFHFKASGASRIKLYKKMARVIERKSGYEHITTKTTGKDLIFYFSK